MKLKTIVVLVGAVTIASCETAKETVTNSSEVVANSIGSETIDIDYLNTTTRPQDDFFEFANGSWIKNNPVPASESRWGSFNELDKANKEKLIAILEECKTNPGEKGGINQLLGSYYESYINFETRNKQGINSILPDLEAIKTINSKKDIMMIIANHHMDGIGTLFNFGVGQDLMDIDNHTVYIGQGGIGLPNKDYYSSDDKKEILQSYEKHIARCLVMTGASEDNAQNSAKNIVNFEKSLANSMMAPAELRIPENTYNKYARTDVIKLTRDFDIEGYFVKSGIASFDSIVVGQPEFMKQISTSLIDFDLNTWKDYLTWNVINHYAGHLSEDFVNANFDFYGTVLSGKKEMKPINERVIDEITNMEFGEMLGRKFVEKYYSQAAQERINTLVDNLLLVFKDRINDLDWMSSTTKAEALNKLNSIGRKLGFPDKWEDFSRMDFNESDYIANVRMAARQSNRKNLSKLNSKVDKDEWGMPAHMVNAYYHPLLNEIAFPAGIMQPPFFSDTYEDAVNYGRIGMVIGHEFTHGFDDMGSKFAADGSFKNWWTEKDRALFEERTEKLGNTFSGFCPIEGHCVNPDLTMGENIADLGGLTLAYNAYTKTAEFKSGIKRKGYSPAQRFFIAYAQLWKINYTDEELKNRIANDPHSPGMYRVNGPLMNCPEFFDAFSVEETDPMRNNSSKISKIW